MYKLIIADDEHYVREALKGIIPWEEYGFEISAEAENGEQALDLIETDPPQLLIADIEMPFMNGIQLAEILACSYPGIKIIFLTGYDKFTYAYSAIKQGVSDYLLKPINVQELISAVVSIRNAIDREHIEKSQMDFGKDIFSIIENNLIEAMKNNDFQQINSTLKSILNNVKAMHGSQSHDEIIKLLIDVLERFCTEEEIPFVKAEENMDDGQFIHYFVQTVNCSSANKLIRKNSIIEDVMNYILEHYSDPDLSLIKISNEIHVNPTYLSRIFNHASRKSLTTYITEVRLAQALKLFKNGVQSVEIVSSQVGFRNPSYFSKCFKMEYGVAPSEFVK